MKAFWNTKERSSAAKNPKSKSKPLSAPAKSAAKKRAAAAGRPYPNLVDNAWASKKNKKK